MNGGEFVAEVISSSKHQTEIDLKLSFPGGISLYPDGLALESFKFDVSPENDGWENFGDINGEEFSFTWGALFNDQDGLEKDLIVNAASESTGLGTVVAYSAYTGELESDDLGIALSGAGDFTLGRLTLGGASEGTYKIDFLDPVFSFSGVGEVSTYDTSVSIEIVNRAPVFEPGDFLTWSITEGAPSNSLIYTFGVSDPDDDLVTLTVTGSDAEYFELDQATGELRLKETPDYETKNLYQIRISATDGQATTDTEDITISVIDVNDAPIIQVESTSLSLDENLIVDGPITQFEAFDADGDNITYSLTESEGSALFEIDSASGELFLNAPLNFELAQSHQLKIIASDGSVNTQLDFTINVNDVEEFGVSGGIAYWSDRSLGMEGQVSIRGSELNLSLEVAASSEDGSFAFNDVPSGEYSLSAIHEVSNSDVLSSADALIAMKLAAGLVENPDPFALIAADMNQNGLVTGADVLEILLASIDHPRALDAQAIVIDADQDLSELSDGNVSYESALDLDVAADTNSLELVAIVLGDVDGSYADVL